MIDEAQGVRRRRGAGWGIAVAFLAGIALAAVAILQFGPRFGWPRAAPAAVPASPRAPAADTRPRPTTTDVLSAREALLAARLGELETRLALIDSDAAGAATSASRAENMLVVLSTRRATDRGRPLDYLENQLRTRFGPVRGAAVRTLIDAGARPVTLEDLRGGFAEVAPRLIAGPADESWWDGIRRELGQLVVIRQGSAPSSQAADRVERARRRLDGGQVEAAIAEVERLPGAGHAAQWLESAQRYTAARRALLELEQYASELPPPPPPPPPAPAPAPAPAVPEAEPAYPAPVAAPTS